MNSTRKDTATATADRPAEPEAPSATPSKESKESKGIKRSSRVALTVVTAVAVLAALGFGGAYFLYSSHYVSTDNAQVDGDKIEINAPATGTLTNWDIDEGNQIRIRQPVGRIKILGSFAQPQRVIKSPGNGTVAVNNVVDGAYVTAGTSLATAYDFHKIYVTARVDETDVADVHVGAPVNISVDAFPGAPIYGFVTEVQGSSAGAFSLFPQDNSSGNFQKVTEVIPVKIALAETGGVQLAPGMNVTVHISKKVG